MSEHAVPKDQTLSLAFMRSHPAAAARVLEALPATEASALFARAPARLGATVLAAMLPNWAALCLGPLEDARVLELLSQMGTQPAVAVLRHLPAARRTALAGGLPTAVALATTALLGYGEDALGAWADPDIVMLPAETRAGHALEHFRLATSTHPWVFVADAARRLGGMLPLATLLQAPEAATLASLAQTPPAMLPAQESLSAAREHPAWQLCSALPVVSAGDRLLGLMTRDGLDRAIRQTAPPPGEAQATHERSMPALLALGYWQVLSGSLALGVSLLPKAQPVWGSSADEASAPAPAPASPAEAPYGN